ncbi:REP-associated tyrosine transposase [Halomonas halocynthiae]|uniref:REP-associated tyrosine transposase n=1 Tax=Halomonas halocynthiae TaxID=176290 RepID=UPI0003FED7E9|nr:transposase [Halomonas halocynthiae]
MHKPHGNSLRKGRVSLPNHYYLITIVTKNREKHFTNPENATIAAHHFYHETIQKNAQTLAYVIMPDHIHWLINLHQGLSEATRKYKARVSWDLGSGIWQRGFHDHALRKEENIRETARYIIANPVRAKLVDNINDYPYWNTIWLL